jgi:hypothetical protein
MNELITYLNTIHPMSDGLKQHLASTLKVKELPKKGYLLKAGHISHNICFIGKGILRCFYIKDEQEISSWFMCLKLLIELRLIRYEPSSNPSAKSKVFLIVEN